MFRYIGNKTKLLPVILDRTQQIIGSQGIVVDLMAGTGAVASAYRKQGYHVIAADMMTYSKHHLITQLLLNRSPGFRNLEEVKRSEEAAYNDVLAYLNKLPSEKGYFYDEFSPEGVPKNGGEPRKYFTSDNAAKIDAIRTKIQEWVQFQKINEVEESLLKHTLIMATNRVANISGTYGYFLSTFKKNAQESILLEPIFFEPDNNIHHTVLQGFAEDLAGQITADLYTIG